MKLNLNTLKSLSRRKPTSRANINERIASLYKSGTLRFNSFITEIQNGIGIDFYIDTVNQQIAFRPKGKMATINNRSIHIGKALYETFPDHETTVRFTFPEEPDANGWFVSKPFN